MLNQRGLGDPSSIKILLYHRISQEADNRWTVSCDQFRRQLEYMVRNNYTAITFRDYHLFEQGELNLPKKPVVLTFDDGYADLYTCAFPLMREYGMKGVVFVLGDRSIRENRWDTNGFAGGEPLLADEQVLELQEADFEIGSHSLTHRRLTQLDRPDAWDEISRSRMALEILLNNPVRSFSYPFGVLSAGVKSMVKEAGYRIGCGAWTGPARFGVDLLETRRVLVHRGTGISAFAARLTSLYVQYRWAIWRSWHRFGPNGDDQA